MTTFYLSFCDTMPTETNSLIPAAPGPEDAVTAPKQADPNETQPDSVSDTTINDIESGWLMHNYEAKVGPVPMTLWLWTN